MGSTPLKVIKMKSKPEPLQMDFKNQKDRYNALLDKCNLLIGRDLTDKLIEIQEGPLNAIKTRIENSYATYESKIKEAEINQQEYYVVMYATVTAKVIKKHFMIPNYNLFKSIPLFCSKLSLKEDKLTKIKVSLDVFQKEFENNLHSIVYNLKSDFKDLPDPVLFGINYNLKFNDTTQASILNIILTPAVLKKEALILDLVDLIEHSEKLQIISLLFEPKDEEGNEFETFNFTITHHKILNRLINAVNNNRLIKGLFVHCTTDYGIAISPETSALIISKLQSETLVAFHIGGFDFSEQFLGNLMFQITSTRALLFFSIHSKQMNKLYDKVMNGIAKNTSLTTIVVSGFNIHRDQYAMNYFENELSLKNKTVNLVYCCEESVVKYPFCIA